MARESVNGIASLQFPSSRSQKCTTTFRNWSVSCMRRFIGDKPLDTPALVVSYRIGDYPRAGLRNYPWEMTDTRALLLNAFDLLANKRTKAFAQHIQQCKGKIHEFVKFSGPIILDSGAFNFLQ